MARKTKYDGDHTITLIRGYAMEGMTDPEIAAKLHIGLRTLYDWCARYPQLAQALKDGKEGPDFEVEQALFKKAKGGDVTACIFWLKNRKPQAWRDRPKDEQLGLDDPIRQLLQVISDGRRAA